MSGLTRSTRWPARPHRRLRATAWRVAVVLLLAAVFVPLSSGSAEASSGSFVATDLLNLRVEPGTGAAVIDQMWSGEHLTVLDGPTEDGWYYVDYAGEAGWAFGGYLTVDDVAGWATPEETGVGGTRGAAWVDTDGLNVRSGADRDAGVIDTVVQGTELEVVGAEVDGFYPVAYGGGLGWVWGKYVSWEPVSAGPEEWLDVDRSSGTVRMMVGDEPIATYAASMGFDGSADGFYATAIGSYRVYEKIAGLTWSPFARAYIKSWVGFDPSRLNGFHAYTMDGDGRQIRGGDGPTGGCIATDPEAAKELYAFASLGMRVEVHW